MSSAESYLMSKLNDPDIQNDPYTLAVVGYAFSLGNQGETTQRIFDSLKDLAKHESMSLYNMLCVVWNVKYNLLCIVIMDMYCNM